MSNLKNKFKIEEIISATSGIVINGVDYIDNYDKISRALTEANMYDDYKSLPENIYDAFPEYKLKEATEEFRALIKSWKERGDNLTFIDISMNAKGMAADAGIPQELTIEEDKAKQQERVNQFNLSKMKILRTIAKENVSPEKGVVNPKRSAKEKHNIKLVLDNISKRIND